MIKTVGIVGLGLIGGSMGKAIRKFKEVEILGTDLQAEVVKEACEEGILNGQLSEERIKECNLLILALFTEDVIQYLKTRMEEIAPGTIVVDCTGMKERICRELSPMLNASGIHFIGGHPMAGTEQSGYSHSFPELFHNATMILCRDQYTDEEAYECASEFFLSIGFATIKGASPWEHDKVIAYTSQMAHVVSSAYIKSDTLKERYGFSAGSFRDLTRVAKLNEEMWTQLFFDNRDNLIKEMDSFIENMKEYRDALASMDERRMQELLKDGRERKEADLLAEQQWRQQEKQGE